MYTYHQEKKEQNIGFLKIEKRGNHVKMQGNFRVRQRSDMGEDYQLYMLVADDNHWYRIPVDCMQKKGNIMEIYLETEADNVLQSGYRVEQTAGVQIVNSGKTEKQYFLAAVWVNEIPNWEMLSEENILQNVEANVEINIETNAETNAETKPEINAEANAEIKPEINAEANIKANIETNTEENYTSSIVQLLENYVNQEELTEQSCEEAGVGQTEECEESSEQIKENAEQNSESESDCGIKNDSISDSEPLGEKLEELWQNWRKLYCKCQIPYNNTVLNGIKIQISDIERFPSNYWQFAGNPFVLHGYYYFRYIVFAKDEDGNFYLGVPGVYHDREKMAAALFGFGQFAKMPPLEGIDGEFGYWLVVIYSHMKFSSSQ